MTGGGGSHGILGRFVYVHHRLVLQHADKIDAYEAAHGT
jgi:hypothetical protein